MKTQKKATDQVQQQRENEYNPNSTQGMQQRERSDLGREAEDKGKFDNTKQPLAKDNQKAAGAKSKDATSAGKGLGKDNKSKIGL